jgi:mono/diheme cytochrome c family protein
MNKRILTGAVIMATSVGLSVSGIAFADNDSRYSDNDNSSVDNESRDRGNDNSGRKGRYKLFKRSATVPAATNKLYATECGSCHFAYQPGWLPVRSWQKMMGELDQHFDENAELDQESRDAITKYLATEAADVKPNRKSRKILRSIRDNDAPQRISTLRYMLRKHDEIPKRLMEDNAKVGSAANCAACHTEASAGHFNEHGVKIPGYGPWDD